MRETPDQAAINKLVQKLRPKQTPNNAQRNGHAATSASVTQLSDSEVLEKLFGETSKGHQWREVYNGNWEPYYGSQSDADAAILYKLAFWTDRDGSQMERIMRGSGLSRKKWDARRGGSTWLADEIDNAIEDTSEGYRVRPVRPRSRQSKEGVGSGEEEQPKAPNPFQRADLVGALKAGIDPPEVLVPEVLYVGRVHSIYSPGGAGKTYKAVYLTAKVLRNGGTVLYIDQENGLRIMAERAECLGITPELAENFHHYPFPTMPLDLDVVEAFEQLLDEIEPDLVIFDSWVNLLAMCGLDENSSVDIATWTEAYSQKARHRNIAVLLLDHVPKEGGSARGSGRKLDYVDVQWELRNPQKFDRETIGRIDLHLRKDREGWLPRVLTYSVGGSDNGFIFKRSLGTVEPEDEAGLTRKERATLEALEALGSMGAFDREWKEEAESRDVKKSSYYQAKKRLLDLDLVENVINKFFVKDLQKRGPDKSSGLQTGHAEEEVQFSPGGLDPGLTGPPADEICKHGDSGSECPFCEDEYLPGGGA